MTTKTFLSQFGLDTLRQLPDFEALEDAGLLSKEKLLAGDIATGLVSGESDGDGGEPKTEVVEDEMSSAVVSGSPQRQVPIHRQDD